MHVADLELCKELHELSGWDYYPLEYVYDLGYLLRKLPKVGKDNVYAHSTISDHKRTPEKQEWYAVWECEDGEYFDFYADTPEDAACKLAIELFKQGILKRGES